ncbi:MAG: hypothetical protein HYZ75_08490 [Elusimicrobia bacterium]|nr:hypothetical protein [Elusimicrobiota bacterium]
MISAALAAAAVSFFLDTAFYSLTWQMHVVDFARPEPIKELIFLHHLIYGGLMAIIFPMGYKGRHWVVEGARFGALMGLMKFVPIGLSIRAVWWVPLDFPFILAAVNAVATGAVTGIVIAQFYRKGGPPPKTSAVQEEEEWHSW